MQEFDLTLRGFRAATYLFILNSEAIFLVFFLDLLRRKSSARAISESLGVVLGASDDGMSVIVESTTEDLVCMALQYLQAVPGLRFPYSARLIRGGCKDA